MPPIAIDIALLLLCYLLGAIPTGLLVGRIARGVDVRTLGSKNIGATNVWRTLGWRLGLTTFLIDVAKALAGVLIAGAFTAGAIPQLAIAGAFCVLLGNFFNVFLGFKGGKGVAASLGVFLALAPVPMLLCFLFFVVVVWISRYISLGSILAAVALPFLVYAFQGAGPLLWLIIVIAALVIFKHRANIVRLMKGTENKFSLKKKPAQPA